MVSRNICSTGLRRSSTPRGLGLVTNCRTMGTAVASGHRAWPIYVTACTYNRLALAQGAPVRSL